MQKLQKLATELKMREKDMYPAAGKFLKPQKNCLSEYVGTELSLKRGKNSLRAEGVWNIKIKSRRKARQFM